MKTFVVIFIINIILYIWNVHSLFYWFPAGHWVHIANELSWIFLIGFQVAGACLNPDSEYFKAFNKPQ